MFDYRKAFDLIDHRILVTKLSELDIPLSVVNGMIGLYRIIRSVSNSLRVVSRNGGQ